MVVLETKVYVYNFADLSLIDQIDTIKNPHGLCNLFSFGSSNTQLKNPMCELGLCALCPSTTNTVLACPGINPGFVHVELYDVKQPRQRATNIITAHNNPLSQIALNLKVLFWLQLPRRFVVHRKQFSYLKCVFFHSFIFFSCKSVLTCLKCRERYSDFSIQQLVDNCASCVEAWIERRFIASHLVQTQLG